MKIYITLILLILGFKAHAKEIYDFELNGIDGKRLQLKEHKGKAILIVNIAINDSFTRQLGCLEKAYKRHKGDGLIIIGIPSNDFGQRVQVRDEEIAKISKQNFGVSFPLTKTTKITGENKSDIYKFLVNKT